MAKSSRLLPVTLTRWPSCSDCLAASDDALAVACGEVVYVLSRRTPNTANEASSHPQWHVINTRVNVFTEDEWPHMSLTPSEYMSIGEEQSESIAVAIAWSAPELGLHRRSVLGVLTSNLILSLWETDGSSGQYRRTCVVNRFLDATTVDTEDTRGHRTKRRIRSFTWLRQPVSSGVASRGTQHLVIADDDSTIIVLRLWKSSYSSASNWLAKEACRFRIDQPAAAMPGEDQMSPLERRLAESSAVSNISHTEWSTLALGPAHREPTSTASFTSILKISKAHLLLTTSLLAAIRADTTVHERTDQDGTMSDTKVWHSGQIKTVPREEPQDNSFESTYDDQHILEKFREAINNTCTAFDQQFNLQGHYVTRFWGSCKVPQASAHAACITLHPSDMIEHTSQSSAKCTVVFKSYDHIGQPVLTGSNSHGHVFDHIFRTAAKIIQRDMATTSALDMRILSVQKALAETMTDTLESAGHLVTMLERVLRNSAAATTRVNGPAISHNSASDVPAEVHNLFPAPETCEFCSAEISFSSIEMTAICSRGHRFTRCNLSFVAIQEPGISKYCSGCSKQFLDLVKLGVADGLSFATALFDEFDVCPYCQAKYRG